MFDKFKLEIHTNRTTPIVQDNPSLSYIYDRDIDELFAKVYFDSVEIGQGIILDYYKEFINIETNGKIHTQIKTFPFHDRTKQKFTNFGNKIYQLKYLKNPPVANHLRDSFVSEFANSINHYIPSLQEIEQDLKITFIPSSTKTPDSIANVLSQFTSLELAHVISKNPQIQSDSKNISDFYISMENSSNKYILDETYLKENIDSQYIIIDDVMGNGSSILTVLKKLHDLNHKTNYFFIVVKDVKR